MQALSIMFFLAVLAASITLVVAMIRANFAQIGAALAGASRIPARTFDAIETGYPPEAEKIVAFSPRAARRVVPSQLPLAA